MFYDLNVPWASKEDGLHRTVAFLDELGYSVIAISHTLTGNIGPVLRCQIPETLPFPVPRKLQILRRCTLIHSDPSQNYRLSLLGGTYDIVAIRPTNEKSLQQACQTLECDIISLDLTVRHDYHFKMKMISQAIERGVKFEICYSPGILAADSNARRNLIGNATQLIRATRGRGIIISSDAVRAAGCRAPWDIINLATTWGLSQEKGKEAINKLARSVVVCAKMRRSSYRGIVDIVKGGGQSESSRDSSQGSARNRFKRKAENLEGDLSRSTLQIIKPISKREQKRQAKKLRLEVQVADASG